MDYAVEFRDVSKAYGRKRVFESLALGVRKGTFAVVFGGPGSGKSVVLRLLTGLEKPDKGTILLRGTDVAHVNPAGRNIGYVPQSFALYPHYSVADNIGYPLKLMGLERRDIERVVQQTATQLKIVPLLKKRPDQLSGGEKQRVAIARGIVKHTDIFVLDDPLTGLDFKLREQLFDDLRQMQKTLGATFIYTTSDPLEALMLAEDVHVLDGGRIIEAGATERVYSEPERARTMALLGFPEANVIEGELGGSNGRAQCKTRLFTCGVATNGSGAASGPVSVGVRPRDVRINPAAGEVPVTCAAEITLVEDLGGELVVYLEAGGQPLRSVVRHDEVEGLSEGAVTIGFDPAQLHLFSRADGHRIGRGAP